MAGENCLICGLADQPIPEAFSSRQCQRCGTYQLQPPPQDDPDAYQGSLRQYLRHKDGNGPELPHNRIAHRRARLSHIVRRQQHHSKVVAIPLGHLGAWDLDAPLPTPSEQYDSLVLWIAERQPSYAADVQVPYQSVGAWIGAPLSHRDPVEPFGWLLRQNIPAQLIELGVQGANEMSARLTLAGWARYQELKHYRVFSRSAFMAMQFEEADLDNAFNRCFLPAVKRAGFELRRLIDGQPAGCIDDQLRVAIRSSRFVLADLTHGNKGAYWEAGFAEGLGRPVVYTCRRAEWESQKTHFDTNHLMTIIWDPSDLKDAENRLTATIRATLPEEAAFT